MKTAKKQPNSWLRLVKQLLIGGISGLVLGGVTGFLLAYFRYHESPSISSEDVLTVVSTLFRVTYAVLTVLAAVFLYLAARDMKVYSNCEDDEASDTLHRRLNRRFAYGMTASGSASILALVSLVTSFRIVPNAGDVDLQIMLVDFVGLILAGGLQAYSLHLYRKFRGISMSLFPTLKEIKANALQQDEAELQANYKISFDIVMGLSGIVLPTLYVILMVLSFFTGQVQIVGLCVAVVVHLYIFIMQIKMVNDFYK